MKLLKITLVLAGLVLGAALLFAQADTTLQKAIRKETVEGDLKGAIELYQKAISQAGKDKATAAQALLRLGDAYEKQGDKQARPAYERLVKEFGDSKEASQAKVKLAAMGGAAGGGRPETEQFAAHHWIDGFPTGTPLDRPVVPVGSATGELMFGDLVTGESRKLTQSAPNQQEGGSIQRTAISDDGKLVVYSWLDKSRRVEIRSVNADGSGMRTHLTRSTGYAMPIALSPDKKTAIVILSGAGDNNLSLSLLSLADNAVKPFGTFPITAPGSTAHFSPDGQQVALSLNGGDLVLTSADGNSARTLLSEPGALALASTFWTPDGKGIVFLRQWLGKMAVWAIPAGGGTPRLLKADEGINQLHGLTRDGSLYYSTSVGENDIYTVQVDPVSLAPVGQPSRFIDSFATHNSEPSFSPDGKWIAWESDREGPTGRRVPTVIVRAAAGGEEKIVDATPYSIHWSPDSKALWKRGTDNGRDIIQRVEVADGRVTELYRSPVDSNPLLSLTPTPDGNELLGFRCWILRGSPPKPCDFVRFDLRTKSETVESLSEFRTLRQRPAFSPDGKWLAAVGIRISGSGTLFVKPTAGGKLVELAEGTLSPGINQGITWTPDSKQIVYDVGHSAEDSELMTVSVEGGAPKALSLKGNRGSIDPSGRLAYVVHTTRNTNWVARNILPSN